MIHRGLGDEVEWMRGSDTRSGELFSYVDLERRMPAGHPLRKIRKVANAALAGIGPDLEAAYSRIGWPSIAPEKFLRALLLPLFHGIRSERQMMERLDFDLSFRWFVRLTASSSMVCTVECGSFGPVGRSLTAVRFFHFATVFWLIP